MENSLTYDNALEISEFLQSKKSDRPEVLIILGSGFSEAASVISNSITIPFTDIPHFTKTSVRTHEGSVVLGEISGRHVICFKGRIHAYEGYSMQEVAFPAFVAGLMGAKTAILTNLVGGINQKYNKGDFVAVTDHINLTGDNPLIGLDDRFKGERFLDMLEVYNRSYIEKFLQLATDFNIRAHSGVMGFLPGPCFETVAELRYLKLIGADLIAWSLVPEAIACKRMGMDILGVSCISDISDPDTLKPVDLDDLFDVGLKRAEKLSAMICGFLKGLS